MVKQHPEADRQLTVQRCNFCPGTKQNALGYNGLVVGVDPLLIIGPTLSLMKLVCLG